MKSHFKSQFRPLQSAKDEDIDSQNFEAAISLIKKEVNSKQGIITVPRMKQSIRYTLGSISHSPKYEG